VSGSTANVTLNSITTTSGSHVLTCYTTLPNGVADANSYNDSSVYNITVMAAGAVLPVVEGFESSVNLPTNWSIYNPDAITAWVVSTTVGHTSIHSMAFNNYDGDSTFIGKVDRFYTSTYNFTGTTLPGLKFDVAYGPYGTYKDSLKVYYSTDCGSTWISVYSKGGLPLGTTGGSVSAVFTAPTSTQWRTETIILNSLIGQSNVMFAFENRSGFGNWIYIDNINISSNITTDITSISDHFSIYPNPANDRLIIETQQTGEITLSIFNINGQELIKQQVRDNKTIVDISHLSRGVYFVKLVNDDVIIRKIIKE
jgi:hypothetical protein